MTTISAVSSNYRGRPQGATGHDSRVTRLCNLEIGETETISERIELADATSEVRSEIKARLSNSMRSSVARAGKRVDTQYTVETGEFTTTYDHVVVCVVATRIA